MEILLPRFFSGAFPYFKGNEVKLRRQSLKAVKQQMNRNTTNFLKARIYKYFTTLFSAYSKLSHHKILIPFLNKKIKAEMLLKMSYIIKLSYSVIQPLWFFVIRFFISGFAMKNFQLKNVQLSIQEIFVRLSKQKGVKI